MCRGAAGRCRFLETPELEQLRPLIPGFQAWQVSGFRFQGDVREDVCHSHVT